MADIKIMLDQQETIDFDILIESNATNLSKDDVVVRFVVKDKGMHFTFETTKAGSTYTATLPELKGILESGEKDCMLEVICNDRYFIPWESSILFEEGIKVKADVNTTQNKPETSDIVVEVKKREEKKPAIKKQPVIKEKPKKKITEEQKKLIRKRKRLAEQRKIKEDQKFNEILELHKQNSGRSLKDAM